MIDARVALSACVTAATKLTPLITRCVVKAAHASSPLAERERFLDAGIDHAQRLVDELKLQKARLHGRESDVA